MTLTRLLSRICAAVALAMSLAGCSYLAKAILAPQKDISKFYLLTPTADTARRDAGICTGLKQR